MILFAGELNGMVPWDTDISSEYLEAKTDEKICIRAGPEFGDQAGHLPVVQKALYGLRRSGLRFGELLRIRLELLGFFPSRCEPQIFIRPSPDGTCYEYTGTYVDDLCIIAKDPEKIIHDLKTKCKFNLKGSGPLNFHLGCNFRRDKNGALCMEPKEYID